MKFVLASVSRWGLSYFVKSTGDKEDWFPHCEMSKDMARAKRFDTLFLEDVASAFDLILKHEFRIIEDHEPERRDESSN